MTNMMYRRDEERDHHEDDDDDDDDDGNDNGSSPTSVSMPTPTPLTSHTLPSPTIAAIPQVTITVPELAIPPPTNTAGSQDNLDNHSFGDLGHGAKGGIVMAIIFVVVVVALCSSWFCCGGKGFWARKLSQRRSTVLPLHMAESQASHVGLRPSESAQQMSEVGSQGDAPPKYEEIVPMQHQSVASGSYDIGSYHTGSYHTGSEEESGMVADGRTPLSEIPFEDVVLEDHTRPSPSTGTTSFAGQFDAIHHNGRGDTTGHTNS